MWKIANVAIHKKSKTSTMEYIPISLFHFGEGL